MGDKSYLFGKGGRDSLFDSGPNQRLHEPIAESDPGEASCSAFGYLRGHHEQALGVEFRFRDGNREWLSYSLLASCRFDPSIGLLMKFTSDVTTLILIRGSNLDLPVNDGTVDLIQGGLERHRILWVREMDDHEIQSIGEREATVDRIKAAEFETQAELREWLRITAPQFLSGRGGIA